MLPAYERLQCAFCIWQEGPEKTLEKALEDERISGEDATLVMPGGEPI